MATHATDVEHPQASRSHLSPNLPAARGRGVSGATRGGVRNRSRIFAPPRSGRRSTPAPSGGSGPILLIVDGAKYRVGLEAAFWWHRNWWLSLSSSGLTLNECDAVPAATLALRARRRGEAGRVLKSENKPRSSVLALLRTGRNRWISSNIFPAFSLHLT